MQVERRQEVCELSYVEFVKYRGVVSCNLLDGRDCLAGLRLVGQKAQENQMRERQPDIHYPRDGDASISRACAPAQDYRQQENYHHAHGQDRQKFLDVAQPRATHQQDQCQRAENVRRDYARPPKRARKLVPRKER